MSSIDTYFVKDGLMNGQEGEFAAICGSPPIISFETARKRGFIQRDGWYYLLDGMDDGVGPYPSRDEALEAAEEEMK